MYLFHACFIVVSGIVALADAQQHYIRPERVVASADARQLLLRPMPHLQKLPIPQLHRPQMFFLRGSADNKLADSIYTKAP